jgi:branched-chain amino acid transport system substrate-binding protein
MKQYLPFMRTYMPGANVDDGYYTSGYNRSVLLARVLKTCGDDLSREAVMRRVSNLKDIDLPRLLPGIKVNTSPTDFAPIEQMQLARFNGRSWVRFGDILGR